MLHKQQLIEYLLLMHLPQLILVLVLVVHLLLFAGHVIDWYWTDMTYPASAYDAEGPLDADGALVDDG